MALSNTGGVVDNYYVGKGKVFWTPDGGTERDVGNVPEFEFTPAVDLLDHFSSRTGVKTRDRRVTIQKTASLRMVMDEWISANAAMLLMATEHTAFTLTTTADTANGAATLDNLLSTAGLVSGERYDVSGTGIPAGAQFVWDGDANQTMVNESGVAVNATADGTGVSVTITAPVTLDIFSLSEVKGSIRFEGTNDIGPRIRMTFPSVTFTPSSSINPISDEWGTMEITGDVLAVNGVFGRYYWNKDHL